MENIPCFSIVFGQAEQERFASLSGDVNPMHMDPLFARRTQAGFPVVHGVHVLLFCLEGLSNNLDEKSLPKGVLVRFLRPTLVGDKIDYYFFSKNESVWKIKACTEGIVVAKIQISFHPQQRNNCNCTNSPPQLGNMPEHLGFEDIDGLFGSVKIPGTDEEFQKYLPKCNKWLGSQVIRDLISLSTVVGMKCPGLHSIMASLEISLAKCDDYDYLNYQVVSADKRYQMVSLNVAGPSLSGRVEAFMRMPPITQRSISELSQEILPKEFENQIALIVGGSRGLGELTAKIIAAGGGLPIITYVVGKDDAERVAQEITEFGARCDIMQYNVSMPVKDQLSALPAKISCLYYFATPQIFIRKDPKFNPDVFHKFCTFYCDAFVDLVEALDNRQERELFVFYPSTTALEDRPDGITEYAMAKAAGEILCEDISRWSKKVHIYVERLPRILTDQTATITAVESADAFKVLKPIIQKCVALTRR